MREILMNSCQINAVVSLPSGVFKPYAGVKTAIIFYTKGGKTDKVWFYEVVGDGFTLDDKRNPDPKNDNLKDLFEAFEKKEAGPYSWIVNRDEVVAEEYNLTASRYKPASTEIINHRDPKEIIMEVMKLEKEIVEGLENLKKKI